MNDNALIKVTDLKKHYNGGEVKALDGVNCEIKKGEVVVVIGPSGSGKSTFLRSLNLLEFPTGGQIVFNGEDITAPKTNINKHRQKMGMVFQHFNLFPNMTILGNMTSAPIKILRKSKQEAEEKARREANITEYEVVSVFRYIENRTNQFGGVTDTNICYAFEYVDASGKLHSVNSFENLEYGLTKVVVGDKNVYIIDKNGEEHQYLQLTKETLSKIENK